jgi:hypothetical protein
VFVSRRPLLNSTEAGEQMSNVPNSDRPHFWRMLQRIALSWKRSVARAIVAVPCALLRERRGDVRRRGACGESDGVWACVWRPWKRLAVRGQRGGVGREVASCTNVIEPPCMAWHASCPLLCPSPLSPLPPNTKPLRPRPAVLTRICFQFG